MKKKSKLESAIVAFREAGGILTMSEAMTVGIHRRELYALRDRGDLEVISRGLYRLIDMPDLSLPSQAHKPAISHPPMRYFWYSQKLLSTGVQEHSIDGCTVMIFDVEKTLVDCVKFRNKIGMDVVLEALKMYWHSRKTNLEKLFEYAKLFRVEKTLKPIMETIVSG